VWEHPARFNVIDAGRRWGKSRFGSLRCNVCAMRGGRAWWVFPSYPMAAVGWRMLRKLAIQVPGVKVRESDKTVEFPSGGMAQIRSADNPDSLRGESLDDLVLDECAFMHESAWTEALRPTLADRKGRAVFVSTPKGRNWFWRLWKQAEADGDQWKAWQFPTSSNPFIDQSEIDAAQRHLPERIFAQEYMAQFIEDGGGVFRRVAEAATATPESHAIKDPKTNVLNEYVFGVDWGKHNDFTVLSVVNATTQAMVYMDRFNQIDYAVQSDRLRALAERFNPLTIIAEANSMGEPLIEQLQRDGLPVRARSEERRVGKEC
jgi:phage FluMu gp28-like protein